MAAARLADGLDPRWRATDRACARLACRASRRAYLRHTRARAPAPRSVFTVHNLAYQGVFPATTFAELGLPTAAFHMHGLEFHGQVSS